MQQVPGHLRPKEMRGDLSSEFIGGACKEDWGSKPSSSVEDRTWFGTIIRRFAEVKPEDLPFLVQENRSGTGHEAKPRVVFCDSQFLDPFPGRIAEKEERRI